MDPTRDRRAGARGLAPGRVIPGARARPAAVVVAALLLATAAGAAPDAGWPLHGLTHAEERHSPLDRIHRGNVDGLGLAWEFDMRSTRGLEATPIVVDGVLYATGTWSRVFALDAASGRLLWEYDPQVPRAWGIRLCCDVVNRGVAVADGRVYFGTLDGRLIALDAAGGTRIWEVDTLIDRSQSYSITGAPRVVKGRVIIGNGGAEYGVRGYLSAYDVETGTLAWRFFTVPGSATGPFEHPELEHAASTWDPQRDWRAGGGGTVWDSMAYDPELDLLYVGTGNGSPWPRYKRSPAGGDNLFLSSILALDPDRGRLVWHYQTTPGDNWDYTATQHMILTELRIDGRARKVLMQAPKNGFFYVLDRATGELISADPYVYVNWASHVDPVTGRPVETPHGDYRKGERYVFPSAAGGHNWQPMAFSPRTGLVYIPAREAGWVYNLAEDKWFTWGVSDVEALSRGQSLPEIAGALIAWDPVRRRAAWRRALPNIWNGGVLSTAGDLVLFGTAAGQLVALDAASGETLKTIEVGTGIIAPPVSYAAGGEQYIAVLAGWGGPAFNTLRGDEALLRYANHGRLLAFRLGGAPVPLPPAVAPRGPIPEPPPIEATPAQLEHGRGLYVTHCGGCHGMYGSTPMLPDLRRLTPEKHALFTDIVLGGLLESAGMGSFAGVLDAADVRAIQAYVVRLARDTR